MQQELSDIPKKRFNDSSHTKFGDAPSTKRARVMPQVAGKIIRLELENFMCHSSLTLNFDVSTYNCCYIIGPNGSGKSALYAALNIGLGGTGRSNERGRGVKDYIKENADYALIRIHMTNEGSNKISDYKEVIVVERRITEKTSTFVIKSRSIQGGKEEVSLKKNFKHELDLILQQFNIELTNPLSWLSQDRSRQFFMTMKPNELYRLYRESSEMDGTESIFRIIDTYFHELSKMIKSMDRERIAKEDKYREMKMRHDAVNQLKEKKLEIQRLRWYMIWAPCRDAKNGMEELEEKIEITNKKRNDLQCTKDTLSEQLGDINRRQVKFEEELEVAAFKCRSHNEKINENKRKARELKLELHDLNEPAKRKRLKIQSFDAEILRGKECLQELTENAGLDIEAERERIIEEQAKIAKQMDANELEKSGFVRELSSLEKNCQELKGKFQTSAVAHSQLENAKARIVEEKNLFEQSKTDKLAIFGRDVPQLIQLIDSHIEVFKKRPIGPLGNYIKLRDQKWANPMEYYLRNLLTLFLCDSSEDRKAFDEICHLRQIKRPPVITAGFYDHKFDISENEPPDEYQTIARMFEIENPTVYNYILDKVRAESVLLFEDDNIARKTMYPQPPPNAFKAITLACSTVNPKRGGNRPYQYFRDTTFFKSRVFAKGFMANCLSDFAERLHQVTEQMKQTSVGLQKSKNDLQAIENKISELRRKKNQIDLHINNLNEKRYLNEEELRKFDNQSEDQITTQRNSIREAEEQKQKALVELNEAEKLISRTEEKITELESKIEASQHRAAHLKNAYNQIQNEIESCQKQAQKIQTKTNEANQSIERLNGLVRSYERQFEDKRNDYKERQQEAEKEREKIVRERAFSILPEVEHGPPNFDEIPESRELEKSFASLLNEIRKAERGNEAAPTAEDLQKYAEEYLQFKTKHRVWVRRFEMMKRMIEERKKRFDLIRNSLPSKLECWFKEYMNLRGFKASLDVSDEEGTIILKVNTHKEVETQVSCHSRSSRGGLEKKIVQDLKGLSGGERSFTTACFIMALWNCVESPFRCMDEFDVFMDMVNRRCIMEMLAEMAKDNKEIQFFFFTPQPIHELKRDMFEVFTLKRIAGIFEE